VVREWKYRLEDVKLKCARLHGPGIGQRQVVNTPDGAQLHIETVHFFAMFFAHWYHSQKYGFLASSNLPCISSLALLNCAFNSFSFNSSLKATALSNNGSAISWFPRVYIIPEDDEGDTLWLTPNSHTARAYAVSHSRSHPHLVYVPSTVSLVSTYLLLGGISLVMVSRVVMTLLNQISDCANSWLLVNGVVCEMHLLTNVPIRTTTIRKIRERYTDLERVWVVGWIHRKCFQEIV